MINNKELKIYNLINNRLESISSDVQTIGIQCTFKRMVDVEYNKKTTLEPEFLDDLCSILRSWNIGKVADSLMSSPRKD